jgi:uncharacterized RDD family membrane protein YckC
VSDEIPVGSPPVPPGRHAAPGGWYADPVDSAQERYWDGWQWTRNVRQKHGHGHGRGRAHAPVRPPEPGPPGVPVPGQLDARPGHGQPLYRMVPATADGIPLAPWLWRALAYLIDMFLVSAVTQIIATILGWSAAITKAMNEYSAYLTEVLTTGGQMDFVYALDLLNVPEATYVSYTTMVIFVVYSGLMLRRRGATLGKMVCRLRVVPFGQGRSTPGLPTATAWLRPIVTKLMEFIPLLQPVDFLFPLWDRHKQTLHDKLVRTQVIREERRLPR